MADPNENPFAEALRAAKQRVAWERENSVPGYRAGAELPEATEVPAQPDPAVTHSYAPPPPEALPAPPPAPQVVTPPQTPRAPRDPAEGMRLLREEIGDCTRCPLHQGRTQLVFGEGDPHARLVFVGEGPGRDEDVSGRPLVGAAGQLLDKIIGAIGLSREQVYICNIVKCRPPNNRDPQPDETATCGPFVKRQLEIIRPQVIVALGTPAAHFLLDSAAPISRLRGHFHDYNGIQLMPTYHPAYLLSNPEAKRPVWEDMKLVRDALATK